MKEVTTHTDHPRVPREVFLKYHAPLAQEVATLTQKAVDLYWSRGLPRLVLRRYPCDGILVATYLPARGDLEVTFFHKDDQVQKVKRSPPQDWNIVQEDVRNRRATDVDLRMKRRN